MATTTKDAAHTPGPWCIEYVSDATEDGSPIAGMVYSPDGGPNIAAASWGPKDTSVVNADARLIAAAPDLLKAAEHAIKRLEVVREDMTEADERAVEMCRAAIAKAKGGD